MKFGKFQIYKEDIEVIQNKQLQQLIMITLIIEHQHLI